ncbi:glycosyltransferase family 4 protein [Enhygromyxa salina]|uniref:GDP-mannose-dependent alpha-(1-2)-phosphatidylinositol mannosyltransferase n=1 Tax=Enhygromyxa salina TaxID=215803 RepID=A0A2S9XTP9_9BACT|nr:glycosyltransferase family 4 protein [Enhygromyxa salina]PRP96257.1 GDP-mannose-dependent alpha-(1-2)-phosphatidylinositol mannosyltransferase [Enhygromyxa salina]
MRHQTGQTERVLMTTDTLGGVWTYALELCRALAQHGVTVTLAAMGGEPSPAQRAQANAVAGLRLEARPYKLEWMTDPWDDVARAGDWLLELAAAAQPDLVHLNDYVHANLDWQRPVLVVGHSCVCTWFEAVRRESAPAEWSRYRDRVGAGLGAANGVVAPTHAMLRGLERHHGRLPGAQVIANARRARDWPAGAKAPYVLAAGRIWDEAKNLAALARVAPRLAWPVGIAGQARHPEGGGPLLEQVELLGCLTPPQLAAQMARASIYALPARYEPFGLTALEAALAGCALVLGDIESLREVWGDAATFVDCDDDDALAAAITALIDAPPRRADLAQRARRRARRYGPSAMADRYLDRYRQLCDAPARTQTQTQTQAHRSVT